MGRPSSFDRRVALNTAMNTFWESGFYNTGIAALVERIGIKPSSLYAAFGSKERLFYESLSHYAQRSLKNIEKHLNDTDDIETALLDMMRFVASDTSQRKGCFLVNSLLELGRSDTKLSVFVTGYLQDNEEAILRALQRGVDNGQFPESMDVETTASFLITLFWGFRVMRQTNPNPKKLDALLSQVSAYLKISAAEPVVS